MTRSSRRSLAALTSAVAIAGSVIGTFGAGSAQAAGTGPANGLIAYRAANGVVHVTNADGTGDRIVSALSSASWQSLSWAADGSRLAESVDGGITSVKPDGGSQFTINSGQNAVTENGVYGGDGRQVVSVAGNQIFSQVSDGDWWAVRAMNGRQEPAGVCDSEPALSWHRLYTFVRTGCGSAVTAGVYTFDPKSGAVRLVAAGADQPAFSADGNTLLFRAKGDNGQLQIFSDNMSGAFVQLTKDASGVSQPSLSPDGQTLAYASGDGNVKLLNIAAATTTVLTPGSQPVWQPLRKNYLDHVYGTGGVSNDAAASRWEFNTVGKSSAGLVTAFTAVLVNKADKSGAADGLALAAEKQGPLLFTSGTSLDPAVKSELRRTLRRGWTVVLEGGTSELSGHLAAQVQGLGYKVLRVSGSGTSGQSVASARTVTSAPNWVFLADANDYRTAAAAASAAGTGGYKGRSVVVLNTARTLPSVITSYFNGLNPNSTRVVAVGDTSIHALKTTPLRQRWSFWIVPGSDAERVSLGLARFWWGSPYMVTLANPSDWRAGMAGASVNAVYGPLLWTSATALDPSDRLYLSQESPAVGNVQVFGGGWPSVTLDAVRGQVAADSSWTQLDQDPNGVFPVLTAHAAVPSAAAPLVGSPSAVGAHR